MTKQGHRVAQQREYPVHYLGQLIGTLKPDLIVDELVIVDTKTVSVFHESHIAQMMGYLSITDLKLALLLNFQKSKLEWKRVVR